MLPTPPRFARLALGLGLLIGLVGSAPVRAADITFDLSSGVNGQSTVTKTVSGYTMTLTPNGSSTFYGDNNGLLIGPFDFDVHTGFQIQVTGGSLSFLNYTVGQTNIPSAGPFDLSGGTGTSTNNTLASTGVKNYNGSYSITPGQTVTLTPGSTSGQSTIKFMTFSTAVPEPSTYALGLVATGVLAAVARRRRATRA
jgi:hypothetical protein